MVLDWEQHKTAWVLLQQWLVDLLWLDCGRDCNSLLDVLDWLLDLDVAGRVDLGWHVLLAGNVEVQPLDWRVVHLEVVNGRCRLRNAWLATVLQPAKSHAEWRRHTIFDGVIWALIVRSAGAMVVIVV